MEAGRTYEVLQAGTVRNRFMMDTVTPIPA